MKKFIKKAALITFSLVGILSALPVVFCSPNESEGLNSQNKSVKTDGFGKIDSFHMMIIGKYFRNPADFVNLASVNKKYRSLSERYRYNPVEYNPNIFPNLETCYVLPNSGEFISTFPTKKVKLLVYLPGSFDSEQFWEILSTNCSDDGEWDYEVKLIDESNPVYGCTVSAFSKEGREIVFKFAPLPCDSLGESIRIYNTLIHNCGITQNFMLTRKNYDKLKSTFIPENLKNIGDSAFYGCTSLENVVVPCSVENIGVGAFSDCYSLKNINIPDSVTSIEVAAFQNCHSLEKINIPNSVTKIDVGAFRNCKSLSDIVISNSVTSIKKSTFSGCLSLKNVTIPDSVKSIKNSAFCDCSSLKSINIPGSVERIETDVFRGCRNLENVNIGQGVKTLYPRAFYCCKGLKSIEIPDSVTSIGESAFGGCEFLENVSIPSSIKTIESFTFQNCVRLNNVVIPDSVLSIKPCAFKGCKGLKEITIPTSVVSISKDVFDCCYNLKCIKFDGKIYGNVNDFIVAFRAYRVKQFNMRKHNLNI